MSKIRKTNRLKGSLSGKRREVLGIMAYHFDCKQEKKLCKEKVQ